MYTHPVTLQPSASSRESPIERLRGMLREQGRTTSLDREVEAALEAAYVSNNLEELSQVVHFVCAGLDAEGRFDDALALIEHSTAWTARRPEARALIQALSAGLLLSRGRVEAARAAIASAGLDEPRLVTPFARAVVISTRIVVDMVSLAPGAVARAEHVLSDPSLHAIPRQQLWALSWFVPCVAATGRRGSIDPWLRLLRALARAEQHEWRLADARSFEYALAIGPSCGRGAIPDPGEPTLSNPIAEMRCVLARLRASVVRRDWPAVDAPLRHLAAMDSAQGGSPFGAVANYHALVEAHRDGEITTPVAFPAEFHLGNLPATLAAVEAIAHGGTQSEAVAALRRMAAIPRAVETSLEWPVSRARVQGLLALRAGNEKDARRLLQHAIEWATEAGYGVERDLAAFQLGELFANGTLIVSQKQRRTQRRDASQSLLGAGIDPGPHALPVARALSRGAEMDLGGHLAPREVEVLRKLADGLSYKETAAALGVKPSTVQTLAHRSYDKLGVNGRIPAMNLARELGIL